MANVGKLLGIFLLAGLVAGCGEDSPSTSGTAGENGSDTDSVETGDTESSETGDASENSEGGGDSSAQTEDATVEADSVSENEDSTEKKGTRRGQPPGRVKSGSRIAVVERIVTQVAEAMSARSQRVQEKRPMPVRKIRIVLSPGCFAVRMAAPLRAASMSLRRGIHRFVSTIAPLDLKS